MAVEATNLIKIIINDKITNEQLVHLIVLRYKMNKGNIINYKLKSWLKYFPLFHIKFIYNYVTKSQL